MESAIHISAGFFSTVFALAGGVAIGFSIYWLFNKQAKARQLAELRKQMDDLRPTDPEYNQVRALYTSMMIDAQRWEFFSKKQAGEGAQGSSHHDTDSSGDSSSDGD